MKGWEDDRASGYVLGQDLDRASPHRNRTSPRELPRNQLANLPQGRRGRGALRLRNVQTKVLRAVKVRRAMQSMGAKRKNARNLWARGATKLASVLGFKWLGNNSVQRRKRSIFGNVLGGQPLDDLALPKISLHNTESTAHGGMGGIPAEDAHMKPKSTVTSIKMQQRVSSPTIPRKKVDDTGRNNLSHTLVSKRPVAVPAVEEPHEELRGRLTATPETVRKQLLKKKMKGAITKVKKFVRVVRLSYADTFSGSKKVSLTELMGRLRNHYDPDGIHADANDSQHHFYTDLALLQRESLKHDPRVRRVLDFIWDATDRDGSGTIDKEEYMIMCRKVYRAIVDDTDSEEAHAEITRIAEEDWEADRQGHDHLDYNRFTRAWFQLADHWTHDLSPESYEKFLTNIFVSLTERDADGHIVWRKDKDIHHYDPEANDDDKEQMLEAAFVEKKPLDKKKKRGKKRSSSGMSEEALQKYLDRMSANRKTSASQNAHVAIVQEGTFDRNVRLAKLTSRNGLYIGSVVPPPEGWDDELTHKMINQSAFMRISLKGGRGVYSRGADDSSGEDDELISAAGTGYLDAYPRELGQSLKAMALSAQMNNADKERAAALLGRLWEENTPWNAKSIGSSPGGPGGWLVHYTREQVDFQEARQQAGAGGGFGSESVHGDMLGMDMKDFQDGHSQTSSSRTPGSKSMIDIHDPPSKYRPFISDSKQNDRYQSRPGSAPAARRLHGRTPVGLPITASPTPMGRPGTASSNLNKLTKQRKEKMKKKKKNRRKRRNVDLISRKDFVKFATSSSKGVLMTRPQSAHAQNRHTSRKIPRKKKLSGSKSMSALKSGRRPKSASRAHTRMKRRKNDNPVDNSDNSNLEPQSALETSAQMAVEETRVIRTRPKSAHPVSRCRNKSIEGTNLFDALPHTRRRSTTETNPKVPDEIARPGKNKLPRAAQKITLMSLKPGCKVEDICGIFGALGIAVSRDNVRISIAKRSRRKKARVYFHRYTDFRRAVQLLGILHRSMSESVEATQVAPKLIRKEKPSATKSGVMKRISRMQDVRPISSLEEVNKVTAVSTIRIPKMLRPMSASSLQRRLR